METVTPLLRISILYGAIREGRLSIRAARALEAALRATNRCQVTLHDLRDYDLPVMHARLKDMDDPPAQLVALGRSLEESDGIILLSPEYNNSYSGALKNAVDYFTKEWAKKPIGVAACSSGRMGGVNASNLMQLLVLAVGGYAMPRKWLVPELDKSLSEDGVPQNERIAQELQRFVEEMLWFTEAIAARKKA